MKLSDIHVVSVCVNFSDFFAWSALVNKAIFPNWTVVTTPDDIKTQHICNTYQINCIKTNVFYEDGKKFNKFGSINLALETIKEKWILFLDIDILLPYLPTRRVLENLDLDPNCLYGIDRFNCVGLTNLVKYLAYPDVVHDNWLMDMYRFEVGARISQYYGGESDKGIFQGWLPLGFFQLAHRDTFEVYPSGCDGADHCDIIFAKQYHRRNRIFIPEIMAIHIASDGSWGTNWGGRTTKEFTY